MASTRRRVLGLAGAVGIGGSGALLYGSVTDTGESRPSALVAGSLLAVASEIGTATVEAHGSAAVRQLVLDGAREPDALALADPRLFADISPEITLFATNSLVLAYDPDGSGATAIQDDWQTAIQQSALDIGRTDPDLDPLGYRTVMALDLAGDRTGIDPERVLAGTRIVPETDLLNLLEGDALDAAFVYRSMAVQRDLPFISLPSWMNFGDPAAADQYRQASYDLDGTTIRGAPIRYGAAPLTQAGQSWVERLVTSTTTLEEFGFSVPDIYPDRNRSVAEFRGSSEQISP